MCICGTYGNVNFNEGPCLFLSQSGITGYFLPWGLWMLEKKTAPKSGEMMPSASK